MMPSKNNWSIRLAVPADLSFIYSSWLNSYRSDSGIGRSTRKSIFFKEYNRVIDGILSDPFTRILVACLPDESNVICGFLAFAPGTLHYCFVKEDFRRFGIARSLAEEALGEGVSEIWCTHRTELSRPIFQKNTELQYNPFLLFQRELPLNPEK